MPLHGLAEGFWGGIDAERQRVREDDYRRQQLEGSILTHLANSPNPEIASRAWAGLLDSTNPKSKRKGLGAFLGETEANPALPKLREFLSTPQPVEETHQGDPGVSAAQFLPNPMTAGEDPTASASPARFAEAPPPPTETTTRYELPQVNYLPEEQEVMGAMAGWRRAGLSNEEAQRQVQLERGHFGRYGLGAGRAGAAAHYQRTVVEMPDGTQRYAGFNPLDNRYYDPDTGDALEGARPPTHTAVRSYGAQIETVTRQLYPGRSYGMLNPDEAQHVQDEAIRLTAESAKQRGLATGAAQNTTKANAPVSVDESAKTGIPVNTPASAVAGQVAATPTQRDAANVADMITPVISNPGYATEGGEPGIVELAQELLPTQEDATVAGFNTAGLLNAYRRSRAEYAPKFAALDSKISWIQSQVRKMQGQAGAETEKDATRALASIANIQSGLVSGDSREAQIERIKTLQDALARMQQVVRAKQQPHGGAPPGPGATPAATPAAAAPSTNGPPPAPFDPAQMVVGQPYTTTKGTLIFLGINPKTGKALFDWPPSGTSPNAPR